MIKRIRIWGLRIGIVLLILLLLVYLLLQTAFIQNLITTKVLDNLSTKYNAQWAIDKVELDFFDALTLDGVLFLDQKGDTLLASRQVHVDIGVFSLFRKEIFIDDLIVNGLTTHIYLHEDSNRYNFDFLLPATDDNATDSNLESGGKAWAYGLKNVRINDLDAKLDLEAQSISLKQQKLSLDFETLNLDEHKIILNAIQLSDGSVVYADYNKQNSSKPSDNLLPDLGIELALENIELQNQNIRYNAAEDITANNLNLKAQKAKWTQSRLSLDIKTLTGDIPNYADDLRLKSAVEISGQSVKLNKTELRTKNDKILSKQIILDLKDDLEVNVQSLDTELSYPLINKFKKHLPKDIQLIKGSGIKLKAADLHYDTNQIRTTALNLDYNKVAKIQGDLTVDNLTQPENARISSRIENLNLDIATVKSLLPNLSLPQDLLNYKEINVSGILRGDMSQLSMENLNLAVDEANSAILSGNVTYIDDVDKLTYDLEISELRLNPIQFGLDTLKTVDIKTLGTVLFDGHIEGSAKRVDIKGPIRSELGIVIPDASIIIPDNLDSLSYKGNIVLEDFDLGTFIRRDDIGRQSLDLDINGKGYDLNTMTALVSSSAGQLEYNNYSYQNINLTGTIDTGLIIAKLSVDDSNVKLQYEGEAYRKDNRYHLSMQANIDTIAPKALGLYDEEISILGRVTADIDLPLQEGEQGYFSIRDLSVITPDNRITEDSILITLAKSAGNNSINVNSSFLEADIIGKYTVANLATNLTSLKNHYYNASLDTIASVPSEDYIHIAGLAHNSNLLQYFEPLSGLCFTEAYFDMNLDFKDKSTEGYISIDSIAYDDNRMDCLYGEIYSDNDALNVDISVYNAIVADKINLSDININNVIADNKIKTNLISGKDTLNQKVNLFTTLDILSAKPVLSFDDNIIVNGKKWNISEGNKITISDGKVLVTDFEIQESEQQLSISSLDTIGNSYKADFSNFDVAALSAFIMPDSVNISGILNGQVEVNDVLSNLYYLIQVSADSLMYNEKPLGNLSVDVKQLPNTKSITGNFVLTGQNNLNGKVNYDPNTTVIDLTTTIDNLDARLIDPFLINIVRESDGQLTGNLNMSGKIENPKFDGTLNTDKLKTIIVANNTEYTFADHTLSFDQNKIDIGQLKLKDKRGNGATLSGNIFHNYFSDMALNLSLQADDFTFLNTTSSNNPILYGAAILETDIRITGSPELVQVQGLTKTKPGTKITLSPFSETDAILKESFISYGKPSDHKDEATSELLKLARNFPYDLDILLETSEDGTLVFVVDPLSGDKISCSGTGDLRIIMNPNGQQEIYGTFTVAEGNYSFSYGDFVSKDFSIKPGSTVRFNGDPLNAILDIDAVYNVYTSTYELIKNEATFNANEIEQAKSRTNVEVYLILNGTLLSPSISLDIQIPSESGNPTLTAVERKLSELRDNPNQLNNQVFGLLIFNSFLLSSNNGNLGSVGEGIALNSISSLISSQLNQLASSVIKGVDVNIDLNSYNSEYINEGTGGNVTEIGLSVSKQLFNDRLKITAGGNLNLEDNNGASQYSSLVGDFVLEYKLTKSGNYRVRVFSKSNYDRLLNENSNKNGVSLYFNKSFDSKTRPKEKESEQ